MTTGEPGGALDLLAFWWRAGPDRWFAVDATFDEDCARFRALHESAAAGDLDGWRATAAGTLALIVLTDQIPRNIFRGTPRAYATDRLALDHARHAVASGFDRAWPMPARSFLYLPFTHAEDLAAQEQGLDLYRAAGDRQTYFHALVHHDAVRRFGRFPHRNRILGRETTPAEQAYLDSGGFGA